MSDTHRSSSVEAPEGSRGTETALKQKDMALYSANVSGPASKPRKGVGSEISKGLSLNTIGFFQMDNEIDNAIEAGDRAAVLRLVEMGADVNVVRGRSSRSALILAIRNGDEAVVQLLLDRGAEATAGEIRHKIPLHVAAERGQPEMVKILLQSKADINAENHHGETALHKAAQAGNQETVQLLLQNGANITAQDMFRETSLHKAAERGPTEMVKMLLQSKADINAKNHYGETAVHKAAQAGNQETVQLLLLNGANITAQDLLRATSLHKAAERGHTEMVKMLLHSKADSNVETHHGETALHKAAQTDNQETVQLLLQNGADIKAQDIWGTTSLHKAAEQGHTEIVKMLLQSKADINAKNQVGETALHKAAQAGNQETVQLLLQTPLTTESSTSELDQTESGFTMIESDAADMSIHLATEARSNDDRHDDEDILNPEKYFDELDHLERRVVRHSSLKYFEQGLYVIEKVHHRLDSLSSNDGLLAVMGALQEVNDQNHEAWRARYDFVMRSLYESHSVVLRVLDNLDFLGESRFCGSSFAILVATKSRPEVAQVFRIERSTVDVIADSIRASISALAAPSSRLEVDGQDYSQLPQDLTSILEVPRRYCTEFLDGMDLLIQGPLDEGSSIAIMPELTTIRLAALIMDLGLVMYSGSHSSDIEKYLGALATLGDQSPAMEEARTPPNLTPRELLDKLNPSRLQVLNETGTSGFQCSMKRLACLEEFIGGPVWVFEHLQTEPITAVPDRRLFISTSIEDFSDMWGPVWAVPSKKRNLIKHYNVSKGMICRVSLETFSGPSMHDCEIPCHWNSWAELSKCGEDLPFSFDDLPIKPSDKLLIGIPFRDNLMCQFKLSEIERTRANRMVPASTFPKAWFTDTYQIGGSAGFRGIGVSAQRTRKKRPRRTHKEAIWDKIKNSPQSFPPGIFDLWLGLEVSHCTGNARRIKMKDLFRLDPVKSHLKDVQPAWYDSALGGQFFEAISSSDTNMLRCFWDGLSAEKKLEVVAIVQVVIDALQFTGVREDEDFGVGYLSSGGNAQIMLVNGRLNDWTGILKDSETVTTYAILNKVCLECALQNYDTILCRSKGCGEGFTVLETQITVPYGISDHGQSRFFRLGEQGRLDIISKKDDCFIVAKWEQADIREVLNKIKKLLQPQKEILQDREVVKDAGIGNQIFQVYIRSQHRSNFGWGEAVYGW